MDYLIYAFLFFWPAAIGNVTPMFAARIPWIRRFNQPMDFNKRFRGKRLLGANKTWRGLISGTIMGGVTSLLISYFFVPNSADAWYTFLVGASLGCGALVGDAVESFFKRQKGIAPGKSWFPFDQTDYIIGGLIFVYPLTLIPPVLMAGIMVMFFGVHLFFSYIAYLINWKNSPI